MKAAKLLAEAAEILERIDIEMNHNRGAFHAQVPRQGFRGKANDRRER
jgi:hypothetical protein